MSQPAARTSASLDRRPSAPRGAAWTAPLDYWRSLTTDDGAGFDHEILIDAGKLEPHVTWGTNPGQVAPVTGRVPQPRSDTDARALRYMDLRPGIALADIAIDRVFIGSRTRTRLAEPRAPARVVSARHAAPMQRCLVVA